MMKKILFAAAVGAVSLSAFAAGAPVRTVSLADGAMVYIFGNGKMGMEDKYGRAVRMEEGQAMQTADGKTIQMKGDEVARVDSLLRQARGAD